MDKDKKDLSLDNSKEVMGVESITETSPEKFEAVEKRELPSQEDEDLKKKIEGIELDDAQKAQANITLQNIKSLDLEKKLKELLKAAKEKGVIHAVHTAKSLGDPYILDVLHDMLAKEGLYKDFLK